MKSGDFFSALAFYSMKTILLPMFTLFWIGKKEGVKNIPKKGGAILASNHQSFFDFLILEGVSPRRIFFLAAEKFFDKWWWWTWLIKSTGQIKVMREGDEEIKKEASDAAKKRVLELLSQGKLIGIYPEGTRSRTGEIQKAQGYGVAYFALKAKVPIIPIAMFGTFDLLAPHQHFPRIKKCRTKIGKSIDVSEYYGKENDKEVLEKIVRKVMIEIASLAGQKYKF